MMTLTEGRLNNMYFPFLSTFTYAVDGVIPPRRPYYAETLSGDTADILRTMFYNDMDVFDGVVRHINKTGSITVERDHAQQITLTFSFMLNAKNDQNDPDVYDAFMFHTQMLYWLMEANGTGATKPMQVLLNVNGTYMLVNVTPHTVNTPNAELEDPSQAEIVLKGDLVGDWAPRIRYNLDAPNFSTTTSLDGISNENYRIERAATALEYMLLTAFVNTPEVDQTTMEMEFEVYEFADNFVADTIGLWMREANKKKRDRQFAVEASLFDRQFGALYKIVPIKLTHRDVPVKVDGVATREYARIMLITFKVSDPIADLPVTEE